MFQGFETQTATGGQPTGSTRVSHGAAQKDQNLWFTFAAAPKPRTWHVLAPSVTPKSYVGHQTRVRGSPPRARRTDPRCATLGGMVVFTDLDGTLLDRATYSYALAEPSLAYLRTLGVPVVLVTSKTRAEVSALRERMGNTDPFIIENGAGIVVPGEPDIVLGSTSAQAREALRQAAASSNVCVRGFGEMDLAEVCQRTGLETRVAALAMQREFGEPFVVLEGEVGQLEEALAALGFQMTRGGRFFHVLGGCSKAQAVKTLIARLGDPDTVGLGDAPNDIGFLQVVRRAVIIPSPHLEAMRAALPFATVASAEGPSGWNRAMLELLAAGLSGKVPPSPD